jgi:hypothetical protein
MGGMNYHIEVKFEDGISWLARIRRFNATSPPPDRERYIMAKRSRNASVPEQDKRPFSESIRL